MRKFLLSVFCFSFLSAEVASAQISVELVASGSLVGSTLDASRLEGVLEDGTPLNRLGGFSALDYTGQGNRFLVLSDRGPADGATAFPCRVHEFELVPNIESMSLSTKLVATHMLLNTDGRKFAGALSLLADPATATLAFDPEGIRQTKDGNWIISEEYGPRLCLFSKSGTLSSTWTTPESMSLAQGQSAAEWTVGTVPNRGLEGVAISLDGAFGMAAMQGALAQDARIEGTKRVGNFVRLLAFDTKTEDPVSRQYAYQLEDTTTGISEILAVDKNRYLVLERDGLFGIAAKHKKIFLVDISQATDVSIIQALDPDQLAPDVKAVSKKLLVDLLDPRFGFHGVRAPEKPEGISWGPRLSDGRRSLYVCFDNDFEEARESLLLVFALERTDARVAVTDSKR